MHGYQMVGVGSCKGPPYLVGFRGRHARHVLDELDDLLLPDDDAAAAFQSAGLQRVVVLPLGPVPVAVDELRHRASLHADSGANEGDLVGEVEEAARL